jgi:hypothetical protein
MYFSQRYNSCINDQNLFNKLKQELCVRYDIDDQLASEMAIDLLEVLVAVDSDVEILEKYFLVS